MREHDAALAARVTDFAKAHVAGRDDLFAAATMPADLWTAMGEAGLFAIALPPEHGGGGGDYRSLAVAMRTLAEAGGCLGVVTAWTVQALVPRFIVLPHGTAAQQAALLPAMATGSTTVSVAISEPGAGAHPKHLKTRAALSAQGYVLNGEKAWLTNGPMAGLFLVLAITETSSGRHRFSLFAVPRESPGLSVVETPPLDYLHPAAHCGLKLESVRVPVSAMLGPADTAFEAIALPFRDVEDALLTAKLTGGLAHLAGLTAARAAPDDAEALGEAAALLTALDAIADKAVALLDSDVSASAQLSSLTAGFRLAARTCLERLAAVGGDGKNAGDPVLMRVTKDIAKSLDIARGAHRIRHRKLGDALISANPQVP